MKSGLFGGRYNTLTKIGFDLGEKISIKMLSMLQQKFGL